MNSSEDLKKIVKEKYAEIVTKETSCCGDDCGCNSPKDTSFLAEEYSQIEGYVAEADYQLGCGVPTKLADLQAGQTVLDLGSGAGNDAFIVRRIVGEKGYVIGLDMTIQMIERANLNKQKLGYENMEFKLGDIEDMPVDNSSIDVVISNCVLNLVPDKVKAFSEIHRVLKPGAHFCISDIVSDGEIPKELQKSAEAYAGCVSGAIPKDNYLNIIEKAGFSNIEIKRSHNVDLPDELLREYMDEKHLAEYKNHRVGLFSITVVGYKR